MIDTERLAGGPPAIWFCLALPPSLATLRCEVPLNSRGHDAPPSAPTECIGMDAAGGHCGGDSPEEAAPCAEEGGPVTVPEGDQVPFFALQ